MIIDAHPKFSRQIETSTHWPHQRDGKQLPFAFNQTRRWQLLVRTGHGELYVNDELIQWYTLAHAPGGRLGFVIEAGAATVGNARAWEMSL